MMSSIGFLLLGVAIAIGGLKLWDTFWSFRAQKLTDYGTAAEATDLADWFGQKMKAHGVIYDYRGRVRARFAADIEGEFNDEGGRLREVFVYSGPEGRTDHREWVISYTPGQQSFTATAADIEGEAKGEILGDAIRMTYRLRLPERAGGHVLDVVDWLYRLDNGAVVNRSEMRKFGFKAAELVAVFRPEPAAEAGRQAVAAE